MSKSSTKKSKVKVNPLKKENKTLSEKDMKKIKGGISPIGGKKNTSVEGDGYGIGG